jgi:hypothetical protein
VSEKDVRGMAVKVANMLAECGTGPEIAAVIMAALRLCNDGCYYRWYKYTLVKLLDACQAELDITNFLGRA